MWIAMMVHRSVFFGMMFVVMVMSSAAVAAWTTSPFVPCVSLNGVTTTPTKSCIGSCCRAAVSSLVASEVGTNDNDTTADGVLPFERTKNNVQGMAQTMARSKATAKADATARAHLEAMLSLTAIQQQQQQQQSNDVVSPNTNNDATNHDDAVVVPHHLETRVHEGEKQTTPSSFKSTMTKGPLVGYLDSLAMMPPTVSCGDENASFPNGHSLESPFSHHHEIIRSTEPDEHNPEHDSPLLELPTRVEKHPVSTVPIVTEFFSSPPPPPPFGSSWNETESNKPYRLIEEESVDPIVSKVTTRTNTKKSPDYLSSVSYLNGLHRASSQRMTTTHASLPKGYLDSLNAKGCSHLRSNKVRVLVQRLASVLLLPPRKQEESIVCHEQVAIPSKRADAAREAVVQANQVALRLEQTAVQTEAHAKEALAQVASLKRHRRERAHAVSQSQDVAHKHCREVRRNKQNMKSRNNNQTFIWIQSAIILIGHFLIDLSLRMGLL